MFASAVAILMLQAAIPQPMPGPGWRFVVPRDPPVARPKCPDCNVPCGPVLDIRRRHSPILACPNCFRTFPDR